MFSIFDPVTSAPYLRLNWLSLLVVLLFPSSYWLLKRKLIYLINLIFLFFSKELEIVLGKQKIGSVGLFLVGFFFFIWANNFAGLLPYVFTRTRHLSITLSLALPLWVGYFLINFVKNTRRALAHLVPKGTPSVLVPFMVLIEIVRNLMRPLTLRIRLAANIVAGHLLLRLLRSPIPSLRLAYFPVVFLILVVLMFLEMRVTFIQRYVFITLSSLYVSEINNVNNR